MDVSRIDPRPYGTAIARLFARLGWSWLETLPPYKKIEGRLDAKETAPDGTRFLLVDSKVIAVDWLTYDLLLEGEALRIWSTRSLKAINIDRLVP